MGCGKSKVKKDPVEETADPVVPPQPGVGAAAAPNDNQAAEAREPPPPIDIDAVNDEAGNSGRQERVPGAADTPESKASKGSKASRGSRFSRASRKSKKSAAAAAAASAAASPAATSEQLSVGSQDAGGLTSARSSRSRFSLRRRGSNASMTSKGSVGSTKSGKSSRSRFSLRRKKGSKEQLDDALVEQTEAEAAAEKERLEREAEEQRVLQEEYEAMQREAEERRQAELLEQARLKDAEDAADPNMISLRVHFGIGKIYRFHYPRSGKATIGDLKLAINIDFGYSTSQQTLYYRFEVLEDHEVITRLPDIENTPLLHFEASGDPPVAPDLIYRPEQPALDVSDVRLANCGIVPSAGNGEGDDDETDGGASTGDESNIADKENQLPQFQDWTHEQAVIKARETDPVAVDCGAYQLQQRFVQTCKRTVRLILRGRVKPVELPDLFGVGGEKYVAGGVLYRRCANWLVGRETIGEGDVAFKAAGHELRSLAALQGIQGVHVPMACIVDMFGNRFFCITFAAIDYSTLRYGSANSCLNVATEDPHATKAAEQIATLLNLKHHSVLERSSKQRRDLWTPYSLELHAAPTPDPEFIVINAGRLLPPDANSTCQGRDLATKLLRPELVRDYSQGRCLKPGFRYLAHRQARGCDVCQEVINDVSYYTFDKHGYDVCLGCYENRRDEIQHMPSKLEMVTLKDADLQDHWVNAETGEVLLEAPIEKTPLNPDAFADPTPGQTGRQDKEVLQIAAKSVQTELIPQFVKEAEALDDTLIFTGTDLTEEMHRRGINMRYLGRLAEAFSHGHLKEVAVREMLARSIKVLIRDGLSFLEEFDEDQARAVIVHYLNTILGTHSDADENSAMVWSFVQELVARKFDFDITRDMLQRVYAVALVHAIGAQAGFTLAASSGYDFATSSPFSLEDIASVDPVVKTLPFQSQRLREVTEAARELDACGKRSRWNLAGGPERAEATQLFRQAVTIAATVYGGASEPEGLAAFELAQHLESRHCERGRPENSRWNKAAAIPDDDLAEEARQMYQRTLECMSTSNGSFSIHSSDAHVALARLAKGEDAVLTQQKELCKAIDLAQTGIGFNHPEVAEKYMQLAMILHEAARSEEAAPWIRKAMVIVLAVYGADHVVTRRTHQMLCMIELRTDSGLDKLPITELVAGIERVEFASEGDSSDEDEDDDWTGSDSD